MTRPFDRFAKDEAVGSAYDRPNQPFECGLAAEGCACPFGPSSRGECPELAECTPVETDGGWQCNRPALRGGPCDQLAEEDIRAGAGPTADGQCCRVHHCQPAPTLRRRRSRLVIGAALFGLGALGMLLGSQWRTEVLTPGPLSQHHAQLIAGGAANRCTACHPGGDHSVVGFTTAAFVGHGKDAATQSDRCLDCHESTIHREHALSAHGLPPNRLHDGLTSESTSSDALACAACHQEHHGADHDLAAMSNHRCQACHETRYGSFAADHPDLGSWPYLKRTPIAFDHARHASLHFSSKQQEFACSRCHTEGPNQVGMQTLGYEQSCAECHEQDITGGLTGIDFVTLPMIDVEQLSAAGHAVKAWPEDASGDFDGELSAMAKLLLAADPQVAAAFDRLGADFSFYDIDPDNEQDLADAATIANALRTLLEEVQEKGHCVVCERISKLQSPDTWLPPDHTRDDKIALARGLPIDLIRTACTQWFGANDASDPHATPSHIKAEKHAAGGWFVDQTSMALRYVPTGHADPLLKSWLDAVVSLPAGGLRDSALREFTSTTSAGRCAMCHTIDKDAAGELTIHWGAKDTLHQPREFTRFAHGPHLLQPELADCTHCHQTATASATAMPIGYDPRVFVRQFEAVSKSQCSQCHIKNAAGDRCTQCHNYHVDAFDGLEPLSLE